MSIDQLKQDLKDITTKVAPGAFNSFEDVQAFFADQLLPWMDSAVDELQEIDEAVYATVMESEDVLHAESAEVFVGLVASGAVLVRELETRIGNDHRLMALIKEYKKASKLASELLDEITLEEPEDLDVAEPEGDETPPDGSVQ